MKTIKMKMISNKMFLYIILFSLASCTNTKYKIDVQNATLVENTLFESESLVVKIQRLPQYRSSKYMYPQFFIEENNLTMSLTMINYDSVENALDVPPYPNIQFHIDTAQVMPGLTKEEWAVFLRSMKILKENGIINNNIAFDNDGEFKFFYYGYLYPKNLNYNDIGYLALLNDNIIETPFFKDRFNVVDFKENLYLIKKIK